MWPSTPLVLCRRCLWSWCRTCSRVILWQLPLYLCLYQSLTSCEYPWACCPSLLPTPFRYALTCARATQPTARSGQSHRHGKNFTRETFNQLSIKSWIFSWKSVNGVWVFLILPWTLAEKNGYIVSWMSGGWVLTCGWKEHKCNFFVHFASHFFVIVRFRNYI